MSTKPCPINVAAATSSDNMRADEIPIETAITGKVTVVVAEMSIYCKKDAISGTLIPGTRSFLANKRWKVPISRRKIPADQETLLQKQEKAGYQKQLAPKLNK
jgi:hypothetical protein